MMVCVLGRFLLFFCGAQQLRPGNPLYFCVQVVSPLVLLRRLLCSLLPLQEALAGGRKWLGSG